LADQLVQVGHACLEAGHHFDQPEVPSHLVALAVGSKAHLLDALTWLKLNDVRYCLFFEPDHDLGETAVCTEPLTSDYRKLFRSFRLWTGFAQDTARGPPPGNY
jgi:hypothetical protein